MQMETTNTYITKGKISAVMSKTLATAVPMFSDNPVSIELVIPWYLWECLEVDMEVVYSQFPDNTGIILARMDGEWNHKIWKNPEGSWAVQAMTGDVEIVVGNEHISAGDMITSVVPSYNGHTHTCPDGTTSGPH